MQEEDGSGVTRRAALITISQTAVAFGLAGNLAGETQSAIQLPPGVYLPSSDHLGHALMSAETFHPIPPGCPTDYVRRSSAPFSPAFFSRDEYAVILRLCESLLGETSGAEAGGTSMAAQAAEWIDLRVSSAAGIREAAHGLDPMYRALAVAYSGSERAAEMESSAPERICREGLQWLSQAASAHNANGYLALPEQAQIAILNDMNEQTEQNAGSRLFSFLKAEVARAYYTSRAGLKELNFKGNAYYARSPGCDRKIGNA